MKLNEETKFFLKNGFFRTPEFLQIEITDYCPLKCPQCYKKDTDYSFMSKSKYEKIVKEAKQIDVKSIFFNGGEPLVNDNFLDMIQIANEKQLECTVFTSGYGMDDEFCKKIKKYNINIQISLNGSSREVNELSRDGYDVAILAMEKLKEHRINYNINWVARHDNVSDLEELIVLSKKYNATSINIVLNKMNSKGKVISSCTLEDYNLLKAVINSNTEFIKIQSCYGLLMSYIGEIHRNNPLYGCQAGIRLMAVDVNGEYMPCTHLHYPEQFDSLYQYWGSSKIMSKLRSEKQLVYCKECNNCRVCHSISKESHDNLNIGYRDCPIKTDNVKKGNYNENV